MVDDVIFPMDDLKQHIEMTVDGYVVKANCPEDTLEELKQLNAEYMQIMGEPLIRFDK